MHISDGLCTFPTDLRGDWISADRDIVTLTSNTLSNYSIELSVALTSVDFDCETFQNDQYYLRYDIIIKDWNYGCLTSVPTIFQILSWWSRLFGGENLSAENMLPIFRMKLTNYNSEGLTHIFSAFLFAMTTVV